MALEIFSKNKKILLVVFALVLLGGIFYFVFAEFFNKSALTFCTEEAMICPDGSSVGRTGPNCEFASCPVIVPVEKKLGWIIFADKTQNISFEYPPSFSTIYMRAFDWPPQVQIINGSVECVEAGSEIDSAGITEKYAVNGNEYCVTKKTEGAAGSIYIQYAYTAQKDKKTAVFTFSVRAMQCGNYSEPQRKECEDERASFDINDLMDEIIQTLRFGLAGAGDNIVSQLGECLDKSDKASKDKCAALFKLVTNYEQCVAAAFPMVGSNPPRCGTPDGRIFSP